MRIFAWLILALLLPCPLLAADSTHASVSFEFELPVLALSIYDNSNDNDVEFSPNNSMMLRIAAQYNNFGAAFGFGTGPIDTEVHVSTSCRDLQLFYYGRRLGGDFYYQTYQGYYVDTLPIRPENLYPGMSMRTLTGNVYFKIRGSADLPAFNAHLSSEKKFTWLMFGIASLSDRSISSDKSLIPDSSRADFPELDSLTRFHAVNPTLSVGWLFPISWTRVYCNPSISVGFGYPFIYSNIALKRDFSVKVNLKLKTGYEGPRYIVGMDVVNDSDAFDFSGDKTLQFHSIIVNLYTAYKF